MHDHAPTFTPPPVPPEDLAQAAARALGGDRGAFEVIVARLEPGLRRFLGRRTSDAALIDDLLQRTWTGAWEAFTQGRYDPARSAISTFVYAVASNTWLRHLRGVKPASTAAPDDLPGTRVGPQDAAATAEMLETVRKLLDGRMGDLTEQERWVIRLSAEGAGDRAIAARLKISPSTANQAKQGAMAKLRRILSREGFRPESGERGVRAGE